MSTQKLKSPPTIDSADENRIRQSKRHATTLILVSVFAFLISSFILLQHKSNSNFSNLEIDVEIVSHNEGSSKELKLTIDPRHKISKDFQMEILGALFLEHNETSPLYTNKHLDTYHPQIPQPVDYPRTPRSVFFKPHESKKYIWLKFSKPPRPPNILKAGIEYLLNTISNQQFSTHKTTEKSWLYKITLDNKGNLTGSEYFDIKMPESYFGQEKYRIMQKPRPETTTSDM